jgi:hypothetical protein
MVPHIRQSTTGLPVSNRARPFRLSSLFDAEEVPDLYSSDEEDSCSK